MKTKTFTVDNAGDPDAVVAATNCREILIYENAQAGTTDYDVYAPTKTDTPVRRPAGAKTSFVAHGTSWSAGATVGYVAAVTAGTYSFAQEEH
jgi:hypothetical protein